MNHPHREGFEDLDHHFSDGYAGQQEALERGGFGDVRGDRPCRQLDGLLLAANVHGEFRFTARRDHAA